MKKTLFVLILLFFVVLFFVSNNAKSYDSGAPDGFTGSPSNGQTCVMCHSGAPVSVLSNVISNNIPTSGYVPGNTYSFTAQINRFGHSVFGFQISPQDNSGNVLGTLVDVDFETQITGFGTYITHTVSGISGVNSKTWSFDWIAPSAGTGSVTFYGAFNVTNGNGTSGGDSIFTSTLTINENTVSIEENLIQERIGIYPNPISDYFMLDVKELEGEMKLTIYNLSGEKCFEENTIKIIKGEESKKIIFDHKLLAGTYLVEIVVKNKKYIKKIIVL